MSNLENIDLLDQLIVGRVQPSIYAFTTNTVPNYLKVGDTYRPVPTRLAEWKRYFPDLVQEFENTAALSDDVFFRDYAIHQYLEFVLHKHRLQENNIPVGLYYSKEFFKDTTTYDVTAAIEDIHIDFEKNTGKYKFYDANTKLPETFTYASTGYWDLRPNQSQTVENFKKAIKNGRKNLLMYAVMRFGKSFTSLCCAKEMGESGAKLVLVVSAKADVKEEWKKTVESAENFNKEYVFLSSDDLLRDNSAIQTKFYENKKVVVFLTLQDLQGEEIKDKHKELFVNNIDLLIVDETHYGARAESYGKVLRDKNYVKDINEKYADDDFIEYDKAEETLKSLSVNVTLHLSGTPYRILMGSEFEKDDIVAFYQFTDIVKDQKKWDDIHFKDIDNEVINPLTKKAYQEYDNPYFGFPQMVRFAFTPSKSALELLNSLKSNGVTYAFSELLKPSSIKKDTKNNEHKKFIHEKEVLELFMAIDGSKEDDGLLPFLDYDKIKSGKMCQHIVVVLPYCSACDALEELIKNHAGEFKNLQQYEIINISGVDKPNEYRNIQAVKTKIKNCDDAQKKTITLTVNRMLTGSTVEQWDTMIYLKDTSSPQEYDQAIFRLQNQFIKKYIDDSGEEIKFNMKPQTLLVDFDPHRMFTMQEQKSMIYNVNTDVAGNQHLKERLGEELKISPIIQINKNRITQVEPNDILEIISQYSNSKGVFEETKDIPVDMSLLNYEEFKKIIEKQAELGSKGGLSMDVYTGEESDFNDSDEDEGNGTSDNKDKNTDKNNDSHSENEEDDTKSLENKFRTYYSRILFFSFLTSDAVKSLDDILAVIEKTTNERIAKNLGVSKNALSFIKEHINLFILSQLDYKIQNLNKLAHDESVEPVKRALTAIKKFDRISESEVTTPDNVAADMISLISDECFLDLPNGRILDIASKMGEFAIAIVHRCNSMGISTDSIKDKIMSIPTSSIAYEFTRKVYEVLGLNVDMIVSQFTSYDLLTLKETDSNGRETDKVDYTKIKSILSQNCMASEMTLDNNVENEGEQMKFNAVVGNPPYQDKSESTRKPPIYNEFYDLAFELSSLVVYITPGRFLFDAGQTPQQWNEKMLSDIHFRVEEYFASSKDVFDSVDIKGGLAVTIRNSNEDYGDIGIFTAYNELNSIFKTLKKYYGSNFSSFAALISSQGVYRFSDKAISEYPEIAVVSGKGTKRKIVSRVVEELPALFTETQTNLDDVVILAKGKHGRIKRNIKRNLLQENEYIDSYNVLIPEANGSGSFDTFASPIIAPPLMGGSDTFLSIGTFDNQYEVESALKYIKTKFVRALVGIKKATHHNPKSVWEYVPMQIFSEQSDIDWNKSVSEIDKQLYNKYNLSKEEIEFIESNVKPMD